MSVPPPPTHLIPRSVPTAIITTITFAAILALHTLLMPYVASNIPHLSLGALLFLLLLLLFNPWQNKALREQIDHLRIDRVVFDNVYKRLERSLHEKKKEMTTIIEDSKVACQLRDKAKSELANIKQQAEAAKAQFDVR